MNHSLLLRGLRAGCCPQGGEPLPEGAARDRWLERGFGEVLTGKRYQSNGGANTHSLYEDNDSFCCSSLVRRWFHIQTHTHKMAERESTRDAFADQTLRYLVHYGFDGLDLDWEYPTMVSYASRPPRSNKTIFRFVLPARGHSRRSRKLCPARAGTAE